MADDDYDIDDDGSEVEDRGPQTPSEFAALRREKQATKKAESLAASREREIAFLRAGIDPEQKEGIASYFVKGYEGDLTPAAIQAAAQAAGLIQPPQPTQEQVAQQQAQQEALAASQRVSYAAGAQMAQPTADQQSRQAMEDAYKAGGIEALTDALGGMGIPRVTL